MATKEEYQAYKKALEDAIQAIYNSTLSEAIKERLIDDLLERLSILTKYFAEGEQDA